MALPAGFSPASIRLEDGCLICSATAASKWSEWQDFHLRPPGPKPSALNTELHSVKMADPKGLAPQQPMKVVALVGESPIRRVRRFTTEQPGACRPARRRGE